MRITNSTIVRNYTSNLNRNLGTLNKYSEMTYTQRRFSAMSENASLGVQTMRLRRAMDNSESFVSTAKAVKSKLASAESLMAQIADLGKDVADQYTLALNGTYGRDEREVFAIEVEHLRDQILNCANSQLTDRFLFGGTNTTAHPFVVGENAAGKKTLFYNGVDIAEMADANGRLKPEYQYLMDDTAFVDLGLGLKEDANGALIQSSAFKNSIVGLEFMGIGENNIYAVCDKIIESLRDPAFTNTDGFSKYLNMIRDATNKVTLRMTEIGSDTQYLDFTINRMEDEFVNLAERANDIEFIDPAEAIMQFKMQEYVYTAALQMGQRILQPTLFSFIG